MTQAVGDYLAAPADLATRTGKAATDSDLLDALRWASAEFRGRTRNHISFVTADTVAVDSNGTSRVVLLPETPVQGVTSVVVDGTTLVADDYTWSRNGQLTLPYPPTSGDVRVTYDHGYNPVPEDVAAVVLDRAERRLTMGSDTIQSITVGAKSITFAPVHDTGAWERIVAYYRLGRADNP